MDSQTDSQDVLRGLPASLPAGASPDGLTLQQVAAGQWQQRASMDVGEMKEGESSIGPALEHTDLSVRSRNSRLQMN